jgi:hypothetical protein
MKTIPQHSEFRATTNRNKDGYTCIVYRDDELIATIQVGVTFETKTDSDKNFPFDLQNEIEESAVRWVEMAKKTAS